VDTGRFAINSPTVIGEAIAGEVMIINLVTGTYYNLTGTAAVAWPLLAAGLPTHQIVDALGKACGADADVLARDYAAFVDSLAAEAIIRAADEAVEPSVMPPLAAAPYTGFALNRYDDMRALLVVDPVHEVGDFGWPPPPEPPRTPR
jgi:hypothetical protein